MNARGFADMLMGYEDDDPLGLVGFPRKPGVYESLVNKHQKKLFDQQVGMAGMGMPMPGQMLPAAPPPTGPGPMFPQPPVNARPTYPDLGDDPPNPYVSEMGI